MRFFLKIRCESLSGLRRNKTTCPRFETRDGGSRLQSDMGFYMFSYLKLIYILGKDYCLHITDKIIESQIGKATRPRPQSKSVADEFPVLHSLVPLPVPHSSS